MRTGNLLVRGACVLALGLLAGCSGYMEYMQRSTPMNMGAVIQAQYTTSNYEVLGTVRATGQGTCVLGIVTEGRDGLGLLWDQAQMAHGNNFTGIKDIASWSEYKSILAPIFCEVRTTYVGTVVRERKPAAGVMVPPLPATP